MRSMIEPTMKNHVEIIRRWGDDLVMAEINGEQILLDLRRCGYEQQAVEALREGDASGFCFSAGGGNIYQLGLVLDNVHILRTCGMLEPALAKAFIATRTSNAGWPTHTVQKAFDRCDRDRLRACGAPLPKVDALTVYRGVAGEGSRRRVRGLSWTTERDCAAWFADRLELDNPSIYTATVNVDDIYFMTNDRQEAEVVVRPKTYKRVETSTKLIAEAAERWRNREPAENLGGAA